MTGRLLFAHRQVERRHGARWLSHAAATASDLIMKKKKKPTQYLPVSLRLCLVGSALMEIFDFCIWVFSQLERCGTPGVATPLSL